MASEHPDEKAIFNVARQIDSSDAGAEYLKHVCRGEPMLLARVEQLLVAYREQASFLEVPAADAVSPTLTPAGECPGMQIGPYKLIQQVGEGGMGTVFMAEQAEPIQRKVALKVIKPGMDSRQVIARFEAERQALAIMDHVNIARVLDGGTTPSGRPYFVMELVHGVPITQYCDDNHLTPRERLELFVPICKAIQHAHQKGIIHRDLKPSNVLITLYDGRPVPKVIDFGVAKAIEQKLTERTMFTQYGTLVGTLEYMSPEQAEMSALGVDTRSDIYSLGVLLYELLTGSTPLSSKKMKEVAYSEILRMIKEDEPARPSTRISESGEALATISANRHTEPAKLSKLMRGELDWIVMKTLEKDRGRRYETATGLAGDVQRYLNDEPVQACPPSLAYRTRKFAKRNKFAIGVAGMVLLFLILFGGGAGWAMRDREAREQELARESARQLALAEQRIREALTRASQSRAELHAMLKKPGGVQQLLNQPDRWQRFLDRARGELLLVRQLAPQPEKLQTVESLAAINELERHLAADQADYDLASRLERPHLDLASRALTGRTPRDVLADYAVVLAPFEVQTADPAAVAARIANSPIKEQLVAALRHWARLTFYTDDGPLVDQLLDVTRQITPESSWANRLNHREVWNDQEEVERIIAGAPLADLSPNTLSDVASVLRGVKSPQLETWLRRAQAARPADYWMNLELAMELHYRSPLEAAGFYRVAIAVRTEPYVAYEHLGNLLTNLNRLDEALDCYHKSIEIAPGRYSVYCQIGTLRLKQGKLLEAVESYQKSLEINPNNAIVYSNLGVVLRDLKRLPEAVEACRQAILLDENFASPHLNLGMALDDLGQTDEAIACYRKAIEIDPRFSQAHYGLGSIFFIQQKLPESLAAFQTAVQVNPKYFAAHNALSAVYYAQGKLAEAEAAAKIAIELEAKDPRPHINLGRALFSQNRAEEGIAAYRTAIDLNPDKARPHYCLAWFLNTHVEMQMLNPELALSSARRAAELEPRNELYVQGLGYAEYRAGNWQAAIEALEKVKELGSAGNSLEWFPLAMARWQSGDQDAARKTYDMAVQWMQQNNPDDGFLRGLQVESAKLMGIELTNE